MKRRDFLKILAGAALMPVVGVAEAKAKKPNFLFATGHPDAIRAEFNGRRFMAAFDPKHTNTGAATLNVNGLEAKEIIEISGTQNHDGIYVADKAIPQRYVREVVTFKHDGAIHITHESSDDGITWPSRP